MTSHAISNSLQASWDAIDAAIPETEEESQQIVRAKCRGLMAGYDARWRNAGYETLEVERFVDSDLMNPTTGKRSRTFRVGGILDVLTTYANQRILIDHKTCSQDITDPDAPYWRQLVVESQPSCYMLLEWLNGRKVDGAVWDCVRKPGIAPKTLAKKDRQAAVATKEYFGTKLSAYSLDSVQKEERETLEMYEARLANDCSRERPEWYFQRRSVPRMDHELLEYAGELWQHGQDILHTRNQTTPEHLPPRNSGACLLYGSPCKFLGICSGHDTPDSDKWQRKECVHNELSGLEGDGRDLLTNSRIRTFQTCQRKHYYEYELGIERQDAEEREALFFGTVFHQALAAWWECFRVPNNEVHDDYNESHPLNGGGRYSGSQSATVAG